MATPWVVKALNVVEDISSRFVAGSIARLAVDALELERGEEALHCRVVPAVAFAAHAADNAVMREKPLEVLRSVLTAPVGVMKKLLRLTPPPNGHDQRVH